MDTPDRLWNRDFTLICLGQLLMVMAFYAAMSTFTLFLEKHLGLSGPLLGILAACSIISAIFARPLAGHWLDTLGRRAVYLPAFCLFGALFFLYPTINGVLGIGALRLVHGMAWGTVIGAAGTTAVDLIPPSRRGEGIGWYGLFMVLAMAVGPACGLFVVESRGFDALFIAAGLVSLLGWLTVLRLHFPAVKLERRRFSVRRSLEKTALPVASATFFVTLSYGTLMNYAALYAKNELHASPTLFFSFFAAGTAASRLLGGKMYDRRGPRRILGISLLLLTLGLIFMALFKSPALFFASALLQGVGDGLCVPILMAMVNDMVPPEKRGGANATLMTFFESGIFCGVLITGALYDTTGWTFVFLLMAAFMVVAALLIRFRVLPHFERVRATRLGAELPEANIR